MAEADPKAMQDFDAAYNLKQIVEDSSAFRRALNDIIIEAVKTHSTVMSALTASVQSNQDLRDKLAAKWLEVGPVESASVSTLLQQAIKAAQTTPPPTGGT